jgi:ribonuclease BN (tRNA processing enzyme)
VRAPGRATAPGKEHDVSAVEIRFLGTGDAFGSGGRLHTATLVCADEGRVLVDCGASTLAALRRQGIDPEGVDAIALTHLHGDHFAGIPFFLMDAHFASRRTRPLVIAGPVGVKASIARISEVLFPGTGALPFRFSLAYVEWSERESAGVGPADVTPFAVKHSTAISCFGLRLAIANRVLAFSGDTEWTDSLLDLSDGADLFLCECVGDQSAPPHHLDFRTLERHRHALTCRRLVLTHMGEEMLRRAPFLGVETADDGIVIAI